LRPVAAEMILYDTAKGGRALLTESTGARGVGTVSTGFEAGEREFEWMDWSLSPIYRPTGRPDAQRKRGEGGGPKIRCTCGKLDGSPRCAWETETAIALSPDGRMGAAFDTHRDPPIPLCCCQSECRTEAKMRRISGLPTWRGRPEMKGSVDHRKRSRKRCAAYY